ncbi:hypothetical protein [Bacillus thuringiensis]|uniref:hypothetical protein n=1 Tax=Bacillus thuringiensis TaxID=1428 RepID=UPI0033364DE2
MKNEYNQYPCDKRPIENEVYPEYNHGCYTSGILHFLKRLSPGTCIVIQYNSQPPTTATFQGFQNGLVILSDFDCFPGLAHVCIQKINVISLGTLSCKISRDCDCCS